MVVERRYRVLLADGDGASAIGFATALRERGFRVVQVENGHDLQEEIERSLAGQSPADAFDLVICDARLAGKTGLEVCAELRNRSAVPPFLFLAARRDRFAHAQACRLRAAGIVAKPVDPEGVTSLVRSMLA